MTSHISQVALSSPSEAFVDLREAEGGVEGVRLGEGVAVRGGVDAPLER